MKLSGKTFFHEVESLASTLAQQIEARCNGFDTSTEAKKQRVSLVQKSFSFFRKTYFPHYTAFRTQSWSQKKDSPKDDPPQSPNPKSIDHDTSMDFQGHAQSLPSMEASSLEDTALAYQNTTLHAGKCQDVEGHISDGISHDVCDALLHQWLDETLPHIINAPVGQHVAIAAPRGEAKSTIVSLCFVLWAIVTGKKQYILLIADTFEQSVALLESVKNELIGNPRLNHDFPEYTGEGRVWNTGTLITCSQVKIQALGAGKRMRGLRHGPHRPDLIILDDLENDEHVRKPEQRDKLQAWLQKTVLNLGSADGSMDVVYIGTILHYDSVLARTLKKSLWQTKVFQAITQWPDRMDLWDQWEALLIGQGEQAAQCFWEKHQQLMLQGARVSWPAMRTLYQLMQLRAEDHAAFDAEYQNDPLCGENAPFAQCIAYWSSTSEDWLYFGVCDPSLGKQGAGRDPSAILIGGFSPKTMTLHVIEACIRKRHPDTIIEDIIALHQNYKPILWGVEAVQFQEFFAHVLVQRAAEQGCALPVRPLKNTSDKLLRIESLQPHMAQKHILLHPSQHELIHQLRHFPKADHDDGPDALEMLWRISCSGYMSVKDTCIPLSAAQLEEDTEYLWR